MIHATERMYTTDSGVSLHMVEPFSWKNNENRLVRQYRKILNVNIANVVWSQTRKYKSTSWRLALFNGYIGWKNYSSMLSLEEDNTVNLVFLVRGRLAECSFRSAVLMANSYPTLRFIGSDSQGQHSANNRRGGHHVEVCHRRMSKQK